MCLPISSMKNKKYGEGVELHVECRLVMKAQFPGETAMFMPGDQLVKPSGVLSTHWKYVPLSVWNIFFLLLWTA